MFHKPIFQEWSLLDASVVCQMMGWVVHHDDWGLYDFLPGPDQQIIWRSSVRCQELDMDITMCEADGPLDHSCNHTDDVYVRCKPPSWAGKTKDFIYKHIQ